jgi:predicted nucleic acid-binding protein
MIVLDTNVVSEPLRPAPDPGVLRWLDAQAPETLFLTSITVAEFMAGIAALPKGKRRIRLSRALLQDVLPLFEDRVLPFDTRAAYAFADVHAGASASGNPIGFADGAIAAVTAAHGFALATRNVRDFRGAGIEIVDPWTAGSRA